jgi:hypothetical protein
MNIKLAECQRPKDVLDKPSVGGEMYTKASKAILYTI